MILDLKVIGENDQPSVSHTTFYYRCKRLEYKYSWLPSTKDLNK
jgi:hypothetical protein